MAPLTLAALFAGWLLPLPLAAAWTVAVLTMLALPHLAGAAFAVLPGRAGITSRSHLAALLADARRALAQIALNIGISGRYGVADGGCHRADSDPAWR